MTTPVLAVFFPSLMGVGILVSGALLLSDGIRHLLPNRGRHRRHRIVVGTYGVVLGAARAAGHRVPPPWYLERDYRRRSTYALATVVCAIAGSLAVRAGWAAYNDPLGLFYRSPWASGTGPGDRHRVLPDGSGVPRARSTAPSLTIAPAAAGCLHVVWRAGDPVTCRS